MKPSQAEAIIKDVRARGYVEHEDVFYPPAQAAALNIQPAKKPAKKRGEPKIFANSIDMFCQLISKQLELVIRMEYRFTMERQWKFDYAIPEQMIAIEVEGGVWSNGRHTRGAGFMGDMEKYNAAAALGWTLIRRTPDQLITEETMDLIRQIVVKK